MTRKLSKNDVITYDSEERLREVFDIQYKMGITDHNQFGQTFYLGKERYFSDIDHVQRYVDEVRSKQWFIERERELPADRRFDSISVGDTQYSNRATYYGMGSARINIPSNEFGLRQLTVLHELAHYLGPKTSHTDAFRDALLYLIEHELGEYTSRLLAIYYAEEKNRLK